MSDDTDATLSSYGDYATCPNHPDEALSMAHGETCPKCGYPEKFKP